MVKLIKPCFDMQKRPVGREEQDLAMRHDQPLAVQSRGDAVASNSSRDTKTSKGIEPKALPEELYGPAVNPPGRRPQKRSASQERTHAQTAQLSRSRKPVGTAEQDPVAEKTKAVSTIESAQHWQALDKKKVYGGEQDQPRPPQPEVTSAQPVENPMTAAQDQRTKEVRKGYIQSILSILGLQWEAVAQDNRDNLAKLHCDHEEKIEKLEREIANQEQESRQASRRHKESEEKAEKELLKIKVEREQEKKQIQSLEASVRSFQVSRLQSLEGTQFMPIAASEICDRLEYIQDRVRQASKDFSKVSFDTFYQSCNWEAATAFPNCVPDMSKLANALKISKTMQKPGRASSLVLGCAFFNEIMTEVIGNPFFALAGEERLNKDLTIALGCVVDYAGQGTSTRLDRLENDLLISLNRRQSRSRGVEMPNPATLGSSDGRRKPGSLFKESFGSTKPPCSLRSACTYLS